MGKHKVRVELPEINAMVKLELDDEIAPKTVKAIIGNLPIRVKINRWGDELYTDPIPVKVNEENAKSLVNIMDVAYWAEGQGLCLFFGPTPISKGNEIKPYSPVNVIGKIVSSENAAKLVEESTAAIIRSGSD
jgi:hypothetical protein